MFTETMQKIAAELNLAETTFVLPASRPESVRRVRIFTPKREMRFAGHPTIGTGWVLREEGLISEPMFSLDELAGPVTVRSDGHLLWLATRPITFRQFGTAFCLVLLFLPARNCRDWDPLRCH